MVAENRIVIHPLDICQLGVLFSKLEFYHIFHMLCVRKHVHWLYGLHPVGGVKQG